MALWDRPILTSSFIKLSALPRGRSLISQVIILMTVRASRSGRALSRDVSRLDAEFSMSRGGRRPDLPPQWPQAAPRPRFDIDIISKGSQSSRKQWTIKRAF